MKKHRFSAFFLAVVLLVQLCAPALALEPDEIADRWQEISQNAAVHYAFEGDDRVFDGTRTIDKTADLDKVSGLTQGTIIIRARFDGTQTVGRFYSMLGFGNPTGDKTKQIVLGACGASGKPFSARYEFCDGLYSTAMQSVPYSDGKWHTMAFTAGDGYVSVSVDGQSGSTGGNGYYADSKWNGFLTRAKSLDSFTIGGFSSANSNSYPYENWVGEIAFVTITDEVLSPAEANEITGLFNTFYEISLDAEPIATPETIGSEVGSFSITGDDAQNCTLSLPAGVTDNDLFTLDGATLKTAAELEPFSSYVVSVSSGIAGSDLERFTVATSGDASGLLLSIDETTSVASAVSHSHLTTPFATLDDITILAQFVQSSSGIGSLIGVSDSTAAAEHFHLYINGGTIGYELRGAEDSSDISASASGLRSGGVNTIAFQADSTAQTFKIFANGALISTKQLTADSYRMLCDLAQLDSVSVGATPRSGNNYPFTGTILDLKVYGSASMSDEELIAYTASTALEPDGDDSPHIFSATGSGYYRIPALFTLQDGTVMAAIDARFGGAADSPNNLDTAINFLSPNADTWSDATMPFHFADYSDDAGYVSGSASFIDPVIAQGSDGTIYLMVDAFPSGYGYPNAATGTGMKTVDGEAVLGLTKNGNSTTNWSNFDHYAKDGVIYTDAGVATDYTLDENMNLSKNGEPLYVAQKNASGATTGVQVPMNVFYASADFKVYATSYLFLITSKDNGASWSAPRNMNYLKRDADRFWGTGPGRGHTVVNGTYAGRILLPTYDSQDGERASVIYSDDNGATWTRSARTTMATTNSPGKSSESQLVELPDGTLRLFARGSTGYIGYADSTDGGATFAPMQQDTGLAYCGNVMISVINYDGLIDGKPALILSCPEGGGRNNGIIRIGLITENPAGSAEKYSIDWTYKYSVNQGGFVYSCLTQLPNGDIALLWENNPNTTPCIYSTYSIAELKQGAKSSVDSFALVDADAAHPGEAIQVELTLKSSVVAALSDLSSAVLSIAYPESSHADSTLAFDTLSEDGKTLTFVGTLPESESDYAFLVSIPDTNKIFTLNGLFAPTANDILTATATVLADFAELQALVEQCNALDAADFTEISWANLLAARSAATVVLNNANATKQAVEQATSALQTAFDALVALEESEGYVVSIAQDQSVVVGETATVAVTVDSADKTAFNAIDITLSYDPAKLSFASISDSTNYTASNDATAGTLRIYGYGQEKALGSAFSVLFTALDLTEGTEVVLTSAKVDESSHAIGNDAPEAGCSTNTVVISIAGYTVTLGENLTGASVATPGENYTFAANDANNYDYNLTVTVGGEDVTSILVDNGDGTYTIPSETITGEIVVGATRTAKTYDVTFAGSGSADVSGESTATYNTDYTFVLDAAQGHAYTVSVTIGGVAYTGYGKDGNAYTIPGADISGAIAVTITKTEILPETVTIAFDGNGAGDAQGEPTAAYGEDYTFIINKATGYTYTVSAVRGETVLQLAEQDGTYTVLGSDTTGDITITVQKELSASCEVYEYVKLDETSVFLVLVNAAQAEDALYRYDGNSMFWSPAYQAYAYLTVEAAAFTAEDAFLKVTLAQGEAEALTYTGDVNESSLVDINDAQLVYDMYNAKYEGFDTVSMRKFLNADLNSDKALNVLDATAVISIMLG